ncbi:uncharacterized protein [Paramisgurnus dabryanus]|uniref:uncharacterized protein isoform X2 n=1 Tax=Paramisgurnus dabryanus TaxID=90735 RepID=UPI0031F4636D
MASSKETSKPCPERKKAYDKARSRTRVNIGSAFQRWRDLKEHEGLRSDAEVAFFLLDRYDKVTFISTPYKPGACKPPPLSVSSVSSQSVSDNMSSLNLNEETVSVEDFNDIQNATIDWEDPTWYPDDGDDQGVTEELCRDTDSDDPDYNPHICVRAGGSLPTQNTLDDIPERSIDDTVHDIADLDDDDAVADLPPFPDQPKVVSEDDILSVPASIAYHSSLHQLVQYLQIPVDTCKKIEQRTRQYCGASKPFRIEIRSRGTAAIIKWTCPRGHSVWKWTSQPCLKFGMNAGDFLLSSNILLSGNNFAKVALLFKFMNIKMVSRTSFFRIQDHFCVDSIQKFWDNKREESIHQLQSKDSVVVLCDGRMDSPGFCAQYCTYTAMENDTKKIIYITNIDKRETARNSVIMEKEGFLRTFHTLQREVKLTEMCTDAHTQISALFNPAKGQLRDAGVHHSLDVWHGAKNLSKRILAASQQKQCSILLLWSKDICNHFWYCCKMADNYDTFFDMWIGLLHHVTGEHSWALGSCHHGPLTETRERNWIESNYVAHQKLTELVLDARWLKDIPKYLHFRSTAELESFHNHILMYASKRFSFTPPVYNARILLAALDYCHHINRCPKKNRRWQNSVRKTIQQKVTHMALADCKTAKGLQLCSGHTSIYYAVKTLM